MHVWLGPGPLLSSLWTLNPSRVCANDSQFNLSSPNLSPIQPAECPHNTCRRVFLDASNLPRYTAELLPPPTAPDARPAGGQTEGFPTTMNNLRSPDAQDKNLDLSVILGSPSFSYTLQVVHQ